MTDLVVGRDEHAGARLEADVARLGVGFGNPPVGVDIGKGH